MNRILLRVRLLYYLKHEIIGDLHEQVFRGISARDIPIPPPLADGDPPAHWWDEEADKCLVVGVYKHGYDRFNLMRQDPALCFLQRCGPPDGAALLAEINADDDLGKTLDEDDEPETPATPATPLSQTDGEGNNTTTSTTPTTTSKSKDDLDVNSSECGALLPFPSAADMNHRLRRIVTSYQRNFKKQEAKLAQRARHQQRLERLERFEAAIKERELKKRDLAQKYCSFVCLAQPLTVDLTLDRKWSRREEADFYRVISSFGVEYNRDEDRYDWTRFRSFGKLERKMDETLTEYFKAFYAMCKRVNGRRLTEEEENLPISVDPISEERASRCLARIDLLSKIREEILTHPELEERLQLCQHSMDLPDWWVCGKHDKDLLVGAAKYGLNRLDFNLANDPELSFVELFKQLEANEEKSVESMEPKIENKTDICENPRETETEMETDCKQMDIKSEIIDKIDVKLDENIVKKEEEVEKEMNETKDKSDDKESEDNEKDMKDSNKEKNCELSAKNEKKDNQMKGEVKEPVEKCETSLEEKVEGKSESDLKSPISESLEKVEENDSQMKDMSNEKTDSDEQKTDTEMEVDSNVKTDEEKADLLLESKKPNETKEAEMRSEDSEELKTEAKEEKAVEKCDIKEETEEKEEKMDECNENLEKDEKEPKNEATDDDKKSISTEDSVAKTEETVEKEMCEMKTESESASVVTEKEVSLTSSSTPQPQSSQVKSFPRFPKDRVLQMRLEQICHTVEKNEWPSLRHSFFSLVSGGHQSTPSVATADSSPRPLSPCSLSSASREPTPHPTPDHTPRREALSPLPDIFYTDNSVSMNESASRRRRRRRRRFEVEAERQKLRNLLSQTIEQSQQSAAQSSHNSLKKQTSLLSGSSSQFLPPLFSLPFCNLRSAIRDELMTDEKTASLLLGSTLQSSLAAAQAASAQQSAANASSKSSNSSSKGPPPAHQSSSARNAPAMGTLDLTGRFKSSSKSMATPPAPAHKPAPTNPPEMQKMGAQDVLDLSSAPSKRTRAHSPSKSRSPASESTAPVSAQPSKKSSKRIGSRIDALALNLQAKKMMEEKKTDPKPSDKLEASLSSLEKRQATHFMEELQKHSALMQSKTPPAAHSKSSSTSKLNDSLLSAKSNAHFGALDASKLPPSKATEASTIAEQVAIIRQNLRNLFEDHPEFIAQNPSMASMVAASAANVFNPNLNMNSISSIPANVSHIRSKVVCISINCNLISDRIIRTARQ